jgi:hypothetical protein
MTVKTGSAWAGTFVTLDATGALATPSTGPAGVLYVDGVANGATVTITGSNPYKFAVTLPSLTAGQRVDMYITATISSIATAGVVASAQADTVLTSDVKTETAAILEDTGNTLDGLIKDVPTVAEFEARTKPAADYALEATLTAIKGAGWTNETLKAIYSSAVDALSNAENTWTDLANGGRLDLLIDSIITHLTDIKGAGWTDETLVALMTAIEAISAGSGATAQEVWEYVARTLTDPDSYKADVSALATTTHLQEVEDKVDTIDGIVDDIKAETDTHPTAAEIWANPTRTLTNATTGAVIPAAGETLEVTKDSTITINLTNLGDVSGLDDDTSGQEDKVWFTVKKVLDDADTSSVIQIHVLYPAGANPPDTLDYINGAAATATEGTFQFTDTTLGNATITIAAGAAAALPIYAVSPLDWDVKSLDYSTGAVSVLATGKMYIYGTPTRSIT